MKDYALQTDRAARQRLPKTRLAKWLDSWKQSIKWLAEPQR